MTTSSTGPASSAEPYSSSAGGSAGDELKLSTYNPWTPQEDEKLRELVAKHGAQNWSAIAKALPGRNGKSCRLRWVNQLRDDIKTESFSEEEDRILLEAHRLYGNRWTQIAKLLPGRTDNSVKNRWHSTLKRQAERQQAEEREKQALAAMLIASNPALAAQLHLPGGYGDLAALLQQQVARHQQRQILQQQQVQQTYSGGSGGLSPVAGAAAAATVGGSSPAFDSALPPQQQQQQQVQPMSGLTGPTLPAFMFVSAPQQQLQAAASPMHPRSGRSSSQATPDAAAAAAAAGSFMPRGTFAMLPQAGQQWQQASQGGDSSPTQAFKRLRADLEPVPSRSTGSAGAAAAAAAGSADFFGMDEDQHVGQAPGEQQQQQQQRQQQPQQQGAAAAAAGTTAAAAAAVAAAAAADGVTGMQGMMSPPMSPMQRLTSLAGVQRGFEGSHGALMDLLGSGSSGGGGGSPGSLLLHGFGSHHHGSDGGAAGVGDGGHGAGSLLYGGLGLGGFGSSGNLSLLGTPVGRGGSGFADLEGLGQGLGHTAGGGSSLSRQRQHSPDGMLFADVLPELGSMQQQRQQQQQQAGAGAAAGAGYSGGLAAGLRAQGGGTGEGFLGDDEDADAGDGMVRRCSTTG
ncbi:hypothetical protein OEZ85_013368 [Tetradesmus obliquus]|uniref:Uncharacterized protein n=1 Tax=Tetradesmus obliquus TaxID=3088 RepID=A0ABY8UAL9_TETOB|nr:hypothetical protein OEZ85_013368 [Tetradesmus obliquus]